MGWIARRHGTYSIWREGKACLPCVFDRCAFVGIDGRVCLGRLVWRLITTAMFYAIRYDMIKRKLGGCQASKRISERRHLLLRTRAPDVFTPQKGSELLTLVKTDRVMQRLLVLSLNASQTSHRRKTRLIKEMRISTRHATRHRLSHMLHSHLTTDPRNAYHIPKSPTVLSSSVLPAPVTLQRLVR